MRSFLAFVLIGLLAPQAIAGAVAPKTVIAAPAKEYAAPAEVEVPTGYSVQSGYEGYLVPTTEDEEVEEESEGGLAGFLGKMLEGSPVEAITALLGQAGLENIIDDNKITLVGTHGKPVVIPLPFGKPKHGVKGLKGKKHLKKALLAKVIAKVLINVVGFVLLFFVVAGLGATVCAFTPLCAITFPVGRSMRALATTSNLNALSHFVMGAIDKYQMMQG